MHHQEKNENLAVIRDIFNEINSTNSSNEKLKILSKYKDNVYLQKVLHYALSPFKQFHITSESCIKNSHLNNCGTMHEDLFSLLDDLSDRSLTGHASVVAVNSFIYDLPEFKDIIFNIIDKNLKIRMNETQINKIIPGCIPTFEVALAHEYEPKYFKEGDRWYASRKLDGCRCITIIDESGNVNCYSRNGKEFETLGKLIEEIKSFGLTNVVFDGEICIVDENGDENFSDIMSHIRRKDYTIEYPKYKIFDILPLVDFQKQFGTVKLSNRLEMLYDMFITLSATIDIKYIDIVQQTPIHSYTEINEHSEYAALHNWEGIMLRLDTGYKGKRTKDLLKVKKFKDAEYKVVRIVNGPMRVIVNGKEIEEEMLSAVTIIHKGHEVSVGSGFSQADRRYYYMNPDQLIDKIITVKYFEETTNQSGGLSLRFPTVKTIHGNNREV